ncbi:DUF6048 family protein [Flavobacterium litorale]|nr:DUF6048 family protein [Flavobacterium litorale]
MKNRRMCKFIINLCALFFAVAASAQTANDSIATPVQTERYGIRVGADLHRLSKGFYTDDYRGLELVADYRITKKIYIAGEIGNEDYTIDDRQLNFTTNGSYLKIGFDYNAYENWLDMENMIYAGMRYSFASFSQTLNSYTIYDNRVIDANGIRYLDPVTVESGTEYSGLTAHWVEVVGGIKAEVFDNLFLGFSLRLNYMITDTKPDNFDNLYIPGFNKTYIGKFGAGFNYSISYFIPFYKKTKKTEDN